MLTVLNVAYPLAQVTPATAGGAEQVLSQLDRALVQRGMRSLVVAAAGSSVAGALVSIPITAGRITDESVAAAQGATANAIDKALSENDVDVVHLHGIDFDAYAPASDVSMLATLHLPPEWYAKDVFTRPDLHMHCVSESQQQRCPKAPHLLPPIPNGVDVNFYRPMGAKHDYLFAMGRICPEKGLHHAADAARLACLPILIAGELYLYESHERYYWQELDSRLRQGAKFIGPVGPERKRRLLAGARCVLIPSTAPETSSLVAMEAAACGTPVIAFRSGALTEIVQHGDTGFLVDDVDSMAEAIRRIGVIDPRRCREYAVRHFDLRLTVEKYIATYERLA